MKRTTKILLTAVAVLAALVCLVCCLLIFQYIRGGQLNDEVEQLKDAQGETIQLVPVIPEVERPSQKPVHDQEEDHHPDWYIPVNFDALTGINEDIYAWIDIPGTPVSYAVVQSPTDDLFYNNHAVDKSYYSGGSIYSQRYNAKDFQDPVTVLYGHNRTTDTMFAPVNSYAGRDFFDAHREIYIYTPDTVYQYEIFAAYPHSSEHLLLNHDFTDEGDFTAYFSKLTEGIDANFRTELFPEFGDRVITLSTCYKSNRMQRYLVQGVLTMEYTIVKQEAIDAAR